MFSRNHNRNKSYSENLFSQNPRVENNAFNSIDGATALKLDESYELEEHDNYEKIADQSANENLTKDEIKSEEDFTNIPSGVSIESASYMENNNLAETETTQIFSDNNDLEHTPKLFSDEDNYNSDEDNKEPSYQENKISDELFDQDINEEEDFEIPAFLRKQKF